MGKPHDPHDRQVWFYFRSLSEKKGFHTSQLQDFVASVVATRGTVVKDQDAIKVFGAPAAPELRLTDGVCAR